MERLAKNSGGYRGEAIDLAKVLRETEQAAAAANWLCDTVHLTASGATCPLDFVGYRRLPPAPLKHFYLSAGIHGDEPAGPLAVLQLLQENRWPAGVAIWLCPCLNPSGLILSQRENFQGIDLNRDYRHLQSEEVRAHLDWLKQQPNFDLTLCLHEDWEAQGFYVYEVNPDNQPSLAGKMIDAVARVCPIEHAPLIDDWEAAGGIIRPKVNPAEREQWPEALYLVTNKTRHSYTLEAPSDFPLSGRVTALVTAVRAALESI